MYKKIAIILIYKIEIILWQRRFFTRTRNARPYGKRLQGILGERKIKYY